LDEVKASQMKNYKLVNIRKYGPACNFSSARAFTFAQRVKELNVVVVVDAELISWAIRNDLFFEKIAFFVALALS
jgi:hypothetical protein